MNKKKVNYWTGLGLQVIGVILQIPGQFIQFTSALVYALGKGLEWPFIKLYDWGGRITDRNVGEDE